MNAADNANDAILKASIASLLDQATARAADARTAMNAGSASSPPLGSPPRLNGAAGVIGTTKKALDALSAASGFGSGLLPGHQGPPVLSRVPPDATTTTVAGGRPYSVTIGKSTSGGGGVCVTSSSAAAPAPSGPLPIDLLQHFAETALQIQRAARAG